MSAEQELTEQFIYPSHPTLKKAYQGIICKIYQEGRVMFQPADLVFAVIEHLGWEDDSNSDTPEKPPGPRYRKAKNILKSFEGVFTNFSDRAPFFGLEVFIFRKDRKRVRTFQELKAFK